MPRKQVMVRKPAGTYQTYKAQRRAVAFAGTGLGARPARDYNQARAYMPTETKYFDTSFAQTVASAADWTGTEVPCTNYVQSDGTTIGAYTDSALIPSAVGAGYGQVNASKFHLKKLRCRGSLIGAVTPDAADVTSAISVRLCLVEDSQPNGAQAQGESVFSDLGNASQCNYGFLAMGAGSGGRFRLLKDKTFILNPGMAGTDGANTNSVVNQGRDFKFNVNFGKPKTVQLKANSSTPTVASLSNYNYFLLAHASTGAVSLNGCARAYYQD
nr:MAG: putative capsid protein [Arizlama virus]